MPRSHNQVTPQKSAGSSTPPRKVRCQLVLLLSDLPRKVPASAVFKVFWGPLISAKNQKKTELGKGLVMA